MRLTSKSTIPRFQNGTASISINIEKSKHVGFLCFYLNGPALLFIEFNRRKKPELYNQKGTETYDNIASINKSQIEVETFSEKSKQQRKNSCWRIDYCIAFWPIEVINKTKAKQHATRFV